MIFEFTKQNPKRRKSSYLLVIDPILECIDILQILIDRARLFNHITPNVISVYHRRQTARFTRPVVISEERTEVEVTQYSFTLSHPDWSSAFRLNMQRWNGRPDTLIVEFNKDLGNMECPDDADYLEIH